MAMLDPSKPLRRLTRKAMLGGVCAGLARYLGWDMTLVRVLAALLTVITGLWPGVVAYGVLWAIIPPESVGPQEKSPPPHPTERIRTEQNKEGEGI